MISSRSWGFHECSYLVHHEFSEQPSYYYRSWSSPPWIHTRIHKNDIRNSQEHGSLITLLRTSGCKLPALCPMTSHRSASDTQALKPAKACKERTKPCVILAQRWCENSVWNQRTYQLESKNTTLINGHHPLQSMFESWCWCLIEETISIYSVFYSFNFLSQIGRASCRERV